MIKLLNEIEIIKKFTDICGIKIQSLGVSYGFGRSFCTFWRQIDEESETSAVICKFGSSVTVAHRSTDLKELADFIEFIGFSELVCDDELSTFFHKYPINKINCVEKNLDVAACETPQELTYNDYLQIYDILTNAGSESINLCEFEDWYVDISHRVRHGGAFAIYNEHGCGIALRSGDSIIINGIAVSKEHRGKNCGRELLTRLENLATSGRSLAFCLGSELGFYEKCGYKQINKYSLIRKGQ